MAFPARLCCAVILLLSASSARGAIMLTFDELPVDTQVDGLSTQGLTFAFADAPGGPVALPTDAFYNSSAVTFPAGTAARLSGAVLEGDSAGQLTIDFAVPVIGLGFDVGLSAAGPLNPGYTVELFDPSLALVGRFPGDTAEGVPFGPSEGRFGYVGGPVGRAVITFDPNAGRFYLDNLGASPVPEPASVVLLAAGAAAVGFRRRRAG